MAESGTKSSKPKKSKQTESRDESKFLPIILLIISLVLQFSFYSFEEGDLGTKSNLFGFFGHYLSKLGFYLLGKSIYTIPVTCFLSGILLFKNRSANKTRLILGTIFLTLSTAVFLNIAGSTVNNLRGTEGNKIGLFFSESLELLLGKSGRVLVGMGMGLYGFICFLRESPKKVDVDFWKRIFVGGKEKVITALAPDPEEEIPPQTSDTPPWIEVKKVGKKKSPIIEDRTTFESTEFKTYPIEFREEPSKNFKIQELKETIAKLKKEIELEENTGLHEEIPEEPEYEIYFKEASRDLKTKIHKAPIPIPRREEIGDDEPLVLEEIYSPISPDSPEETEEIVSEEEMTELLSSEEAEPEPEAIEMVSITTNPEEYFVEPEEVKEESTSEEEPRLAFDSTVPPVTFIRKAAYKIPTKLFHSNPQKRTDPMFKLEAEYLARRITEIIKEYGYDSKILAWEKGPIVTRFELSPPPGVKLSRITSLSDELRLYLATKSIRMVAPIPGKSSIGIEVPNKHRENVFLGDIIREKGESTTGNELDIVLGKDSISGETISIDLTKLPHLLVAGTTGSGKSVAMNSMISYLIFSKSPEEVRFIMIDPKMVEMSLYENIPHLLLPVITDPRKATKALYWAVQEMESRYSLISDLKCRDIRAYNVKVNSSLIARLRHKKMPYIVIFIDELSDLMMVSSKELEDYITRISQKARAVGIHLVMATQRPSVDVITGLIKANCPARIAFHVAQKNDSKIILDYSGADALLGKGDFLYKSPTSPDLQRIQAPYVSEEEIEKITQEAMSYAKAEYVSMNLEEDGVKDESDDADEETFDRAWNIIKTERKASASYLQRRLRIGYNKAARIIELMEARGYVGPQIGSKPREILR